MPTMDLTASEVILVNEFRVLRDAEEALRDAEEKHRQTCDYPPLSVEEKAKSEIAVIEARRACARAYAELSSIIFHYSRF